MRLGKLINQSFLGILAVHSYFDLPAAFAGDEVCADVEVMDDLCKVESVRVNLENCADVLIAVRKIKCNGDKIELGVRGKNFDYELGLKHHPGSWGGRQWVVERQSDKERKAFTKKKLTESAAPPTLEPLLPGFRFSGYFDAYYQANTNRPAPTDTALNPQNNLRAYDANSNQLVLNLVEFTIKYNRRDTAFVLDLDFGSFADTNAQTPALRNSGGPTPAAANEMTKHIGQAVFSYAPRGSRWVLDVGKMPTHVGLELMKPKDNWNYSRPVLFTFGGPFWHTGLHLGYSVIPDRLTAGFYLYNGWGTVYDNNNVPTYGAQLKWTPTDKFTWIYNYIGGPEQIADMGNWKQVHESNAILTFNPKFSMAADVLYGTEKGAINGIQKASWYGAQVGAKWQTTEKSYLSPRLELYKDPQGYTLGGGYQSLFSSTLTYGRSIHDGFELRFEGRFDRSSAADRFTTHTGTSRSQPTLTIAILYTM